MVFKNFFRWIFRVKSDQSSPPMLALPAPTQEPTYKVISPAAPQTQLLLDAIATRHQPMKLKGSSSMYALSVPDSKGETLTAAHIKEIEATIHGAELARDEAILVLDVISTCHTGNPLFLHSGAILSYIRTQDQNGMNVSITTACDIDGPSPTPHFKDMLGIFAKSLETGREWAVTKVRETLGSFLPKQGDFNALSLAGNIRTDARTKLGALIAEGTDLTSFLENPDQLLAEYLFPSGLNYNSSPDTDKALIQLALNSYYKAPINAGFNGLNGALLSLEIAYSILYNRSLFGQASTYHVGEHNRLIRSSLLSDVLGVSIDDQSANRVPSSLSAQVLQNLKSRSDADASKVLDLHSIEVEFIQQWSTASSSTKISMPKQAETLKERFWDGYLKFSVMEKVERKRSSLHDTWVNTRTL
ncbi:hypothetical protein RYA05_00010 [Pseudomonas syringae pv. actinidiae]|nr:hypothetical protein [Pseudomonas syringae pv. actinidiae]